MRLLGFAIFCSKELLNGRLHYSLPNGLPQSTLCVVCIVLPVHKAFHSKSYCPFSLDINALGIVISAEKDTVFCNIRGAGDVVPVVNFVLGGVKGEDCLVIKRGWLFGERVLAVKTEYPEQVCCMQLRQPGMHLLFLRNPSRPLSHSAPNGVWELHPDCKS